jgi:hypothetical protein
MRIPSFPPYRARNTPALSAIGALLLAGCLDLEPIRDLMAPEPESTLGALSIQAKTSDASYADIARSAKVSVEVPGAEGMEAVLSVTDDGAEGLITDVPAGEDRKVSVTVSDASGAAIFRGTSEVDVEAGSTATVPLDLGRIPDPTVDDSVLLEERSLSAGAQSNPALGSFIDLDGFSAHTVSDARGRAGDIDLFFAYATSIASAAIFSPLAAKNGIDGSGGFNLLVNFNPASDTELKTVAADFSSIITQGQIDSLWRIATVSANGRIRLETGTVFLAKSNLGLVALIRVETVIQSASGTSEMRGKAKF